MYQNKYFLILHEKENFTQINLYMIKIKIKIKMVIYVLQEEYYTVQEKHL